MASRNYQYYQPNEKDLKDEFGDCVIRALTKVTGKPWEKVFDELVPIARELQCMPNGKPSYERYLTEQGFSYRGVSNAKGSKRPTVDRFAKDHSSGTYLVRVAHHVVAVVDGMYFDTWDSGHKSLYGYWEAVGAPKSIDKQTETETKVSAFDVKTINELVKRLKKHYPHSYSICATIDKEAKKLAEEVK